MTNGTHAKIIRGVIDEIESTGLQLTVKQVANRSGVNELTLFRRFGSKQQMIITALTYALGPVADVQFKPSKDIHKDFVMIVAEYVQMIDEHPGVFVQMLSTTDPEIVRTIVLPLQQHIVSSLTKLIDFYKRSNDLADIPTEELIRELMGPLLARAFLRRALPLTPLNVDVYVSRCLVAFRKV